MWLKDAPFQFCTREAIPLFERCIRCLEHAHRNALPPILCGVRETEYSTAARDERLGAGVRDRAFGHKLAVSYEPMYDDRPSHRGDPLFVSNWYEYGGGAGSVAATARRPRGVRTHDPESRAGAERTASCRKRSFKLLTQHAVRLAEDPVLRLCLCNSRKGTAARLWDTAVGVQGFHSTILADMKGGIGVAALDQRVRRNVGLRGPFCADGRDRSRGKPRIADSSPARLIHSGEHSGLCRATTWGRPAGKLTILAKGKQLTLEYHNLRLPLESRRQGRIFFVETRASRVIRSAFQP